MIEATEYRVETGFVFPREKLTVESAEQREKHEFCDIAADVYGTLADPTFYARRPIILNTDAVVACLPEYAIVHTVHRIRQFRQVKLDEELTMTGGYYAVDEHPRGLLAQSTWSYLDRGGQPVAEVMPDLLLVDRGKSSKPGTSNPGTGGGKPADGPGDGYEVIARKQCTPETTLGYCRGSLNKIHTEPEHARKFGFRAPIIAGNQTVNFLLEALARDGLPHEFDVEIRFLRPVFWDDALTVEARPGADRRPSHVRVRNADGKIVADMTVNG